MARYSPGSVVGEMRGRSNPERRRDTGSNRFGRLESSLDALRRLREKGAGFVPGDSHLTPIHHATSNPRKRLLSPTPPFRQKAPSTFARLPTKILRADAPPRYTPPLVSESP